MPKQPEHEEFDWIRVKNELDIIHHQETAWEKVIRKTKENPFVPIGCLATVCALTFGLYSLKSGNRALSQKMMRLRVMAQGATVIGLITGVMLTSPMFKSDTDEKK